ncbi:hypothetical protein [Cesiribacter andamanensis]|uniref:Uncharacterized protein n=1 Tax=Cesiribacter andamanensis AMV16 TaxID=1279009 RepID=M7NAC5_9BACT|nr:hypothetical protein [Cesiribacter andamanensis]EMR04151.1 hypothetical protein ADICEAN_00675 [Cesiribacter andamanensis AMV16]
MEPQNETADKHKVILLPKDSPLNHKVIEKLHELLDFTSAREFRENLLEVYLSYIIFTHEGPPLNFDRIAENMYWLIGFFKKVDEAVDER